PTAHANIVSDLIIVRSTRRDELIPGRIQWGWRWLHVFLVLVLTDRTTQPGGYLDCDPSAVRRVSGCRSITTTSVYALCARTPIARLHIPNPRGTHRVLTTRSCGATTGPAQAAVQCRMRAPTPNSRLGAQAHLRICALTSMRTGNTRRPCRPDTTQGVAFRSASN